MSHQTGTREQELQEVVAKLREYNGHLPNCNLNLPLRENRTLTDCDCRYNVYVERFSQLTS